LLQLCFPALAAKIDWSTTPKILALDSLIEYTRWGNWSVIGRDTSNGVTSFAFMRDPYFLGANFVVEVKLEDKSVRIYPGK